MADLFLDCLALVLTLRYWEAGVADRVGRPHHLTGLTPPLAPLQQHHHHQHGHTVQSAGLHPVLETE